MTKYTPTTNEADLWDSHPGSIIDTADAIGSVAIVLGGPR